MVLGLTDAEGIQLSVANEALGAHRALVLSDTRILRAMFGEAALFAQEHARGARGAARARRWRAGPSSRRERRAEGAPPARLARGRRGGDGAARLSPPQP